MKVKIYLWSNLTMNCSKIYYLLIILNRYYLGSDNNFNILIKK